jgi:hypothetical protein
MIEPRNLVTFLALLAGSICLVIYIVEIWLAEKIKAAATTAAATTEPANKTFGPIGPATVSLPDFTNLIEAMAKLTDSLSKVGPSVTSLIGAILFYGIAAICSGALYSPVPAPSRASAGTAAAGTLAATRSGENKTAETDGAATTSR